MITLIREEDVSGRSRTPGRQQFLMENALSGIGGKRAGISEELLDTNIDEFEVTPRCFHAMEKAGLLTVREIWIIWTVERIWKRSRTSATGMYRKLQTR